MLTWLNSGSWGCFSQVLPMSVYCSTIRKDIDEVLAHTHGACFSSMHGLAHAKHAATDRYLAGTPRKVDTSLWHAYGQKRR